MLSIQDRRLFQLSVKSPELFVMVQTPCVRAKLILKERAKVVERHNRPKIKDFGLY
jgi:hypothetical protein